MWSSRQTLDVLGCCTVEISHKNLNTIQPVYVIHNLRNNLLGLPAIALTVITKVNAVHRVDNPTAKQFPELFHGLGKTKGEYEIKLKPNAKPYSLFLARKVPITLRDKVHVELQQMEAAGQNSQLSLILRESHTLKLNLTLSLIALQNSHICTLCGFTESCDFTKRLYSKKHAL